MELQSRVEALRAQGLGAVAIDAMTLTGTLDYQACDDAICFDPVSVPLSFMLDVDVLDWQRAGR